MSVAELEATMSGAEFMEWIAHYQREPWGDFRIDLAGARITALLANVNRDTKKRPQPFSIADFMPFIEQPTPAQKLRSSLLHLVKRAA
jgi:hypothetical protein